MSAVEAFFNDNKNAATKRCDINMFTINTATKDCDTYKPVTYIMITRMISLLLILILKCASNLCNKNNITIVVAM